MMRGYLLGMWAPLPHIAHHIMSLFNALTGLMESHVTVLPHYYIADCTRLSCYGQWRVVLSIHIVLSAED